MKAFYFFILSVFCCNFCFAERFIQTSKYDHQEEILIEGGSLILSNGKNSALMYQTSETIRNGKANFFFSLSNQTEKPINFYVSNLRITDQWGRPIRLIPKQELIARKKSEANWALFASGVCTVFQAIGAQNAGTVNYQSYSHGSFNSNSHTNYSNGYSNSSASGNYSSSQQGTVHIEALRQQAQRQVGVDAQNRNSQISNNFSGWQYALNNFYADSNTIFPGSTYSANIQIEVPTKIEEDLQYILFTYDMGGEAHSFCFYCGKEKKTWYQQTGLNKLKF